MHPLLHYSLLALLFLFTTAVSKAQSPMSKESQLALKTQIFLNQNNFGPGYIDGRLGNFSKLAVKSYNLKNNREPDDKKYLDEAEAFVTDPLLLAIVPTSSIDYINPSLSEDREEQSKLKYIGYRSYIEYMAERYHTSVGFLKRINSYQAIKDLKPRSAILVPNVDPFFIENIIPHKSFKAEESYEDRALIIDTKTNQLYVYSTTRLFTVPEPEPAPKAVAEIVPELESEPTPELELISELEPISEAKLKTQLDTEELIKNYLKPDPEVNEGIKFNSEQVTQEESAIPVAQIATEDDSTESSPEIEPKYPVAIETSEQLKAQETLAVIELAPAPPLPKTAILENRPTTDAEYEILFNLLHSSDLIATFPITTGKEQFIHRGYWKIKNSVELPFWRYDKSLLESGKYGNEYLNIPGGPNNPIGVMWHGLSRKGIGIHGTSTPETIGRSKSAGCIRLSNWNVVKLPSLVRPNCLVWLK